MPPCAASASAGASSPRGIEAVRERTGATCVLAPDYGTTSWLAFYLPKGTCVVQPTPAYPLGQYAGARCGASSPGKLLYVDEVRPGGVSLI